jgi:hypothetical protein
MIEMVILMIDWRSSVLNKIPLGSFSPAWVLLFPCARALLFSISERKSEDEAAKDRFSLFRWLNVKTLRIFLLSENAWAEHPVRACARARKAHFAREVFNFDSLIDFISIKLTNLNPRVPPMERHHKDHESTIINTIITDDSPTNLRTKNDLQLSGIGSYDVLCGRHKLAFNNIGNRRLRVTVSLSLERYLASPSRQDKSLIIISIVKLIQEIGGRFLQWKKDHWIELGEKQAREKVGHALRDMASARGLLLSSSATSLPTKKDVILQSSMHSTSRSSKSATNMSKKNDSAVESSAHFGCDVYLLPAPLELCFESDSSDGNFFMALFKNELDSLDGSIIGSLAAPTA